MTIIQTLNAAAVVGALRRAVRTVNAAVIAVWSFTNAAAVIFRSARTFTQTVVRIAVLTAAAVDPVTAINLFTFVVRITFFIRAAGTLIGTRTLHTLAVLPTGRRTAATLFAAVKTIGFLALTVQKLRSGRTAPFRTDTHIPRYSRYSSGRPYTQRLHTNPPLRIGGQYTHNLRRNRSTANIRNTVRPTCRKPLR